MLRIVAVGLAVFAGVLEADVLDALEVAGDVLDLPADLLADLLRELAAAGTGLLILGQVVFLAGDRQLVEGRQVPPAATHPANGLGGIGLDASAVEASASGGRSAGSTGRASSSPANSAASGDIGVMLQRVGPRP